ncbi:MAG: Ger(x)C family germination protein [Paenibacillus sp.]|nr:Ger(x)C family germination protein [Paenibacillus sp.]
MKARKVICAMLAVLLLAFATGCWNRRELNDLAITIGLGIDKLDANQYRISAQVVEPGEAAEKKGSGRSPVILYSETGSTVMEALRKATMNSPRKLYMAHLRILIIGEALAREGIADVLDFMVRDHGVRTDFYIAIAKGRKAEEMLKVMTPLEKLPAVKINKTMESSEKVWAPSLAVTMDMLISDIISDGKQPVLATIELKGDPQAGNQRSSLEQIDVPASIVTSSLAAFKGSKLVGWLNQDESKGHNYILNKITNTVGFISCPKGGKIALEVIRANSKLKARMEDGEPIVDIELRIKQNVGEVLCNIDLTKMETLDDLNERSSQKLKSFIEAAVDKAQKQFESDIFGFGEAVHRADPKAWKQLKQNWDQHFTTMQVNVKVDVQTILLGTVTDSLLKKVKE